MFITVFIALCLLILNDRLRGQLDDAETEAEAEAEAARIAADRDDALGQAEGSPDATRRHLDGPRVRHSESHSPDRGALKLAESERDHTREALTPTERDKAQFLEWMDIWDQHGHVLEWLNVKFNAKQWTAQESQPFYDYVGSWRHKYFDAPPSKKCTPSSLCAPRTCRPA